MSLSGGPIPGVHTSPWQRGVRLLAVAGGIGVFWLEVLPRWSREPQMRAALQTHTDRNINGSATYYTENPAALTAVRDLQQLQREQPRLLWRPEWRSR